MRHRSLVTPRGYQDSFAILCALVAAAISATTTYAQRATYDQQLSYYDPAIPYAFTPNSNSSYGGYSINSEPAYGTSAMSSMAYVGNYGGNAVETSDTVSFFRISDDSANSGVPGSIVIVQNGPDGAEHFSTLTDFGDLHTFNIAFNEVSVAQQSGARAFDAGGVVWLYEEGGVRPDPDEVAAERTEIAVKNRPLEPTSVRRGTGSKVIAIRAAEPFQLRPAYSKFAAGHRRAGIGLLYGYHEFGLFNQFSFLAEGGILGRTYSDTRSNNWVTGPFSGLVAHRSFGPINFYGHALGVLGLNDGDIQQTNGIGTELIPGALNRLLYAQPTYSSHRESIDGVSPTGVLWAEVGLQITERSSLKFAWTATYVNDILMSQDRVRYYLPDMGFRDPGEQDFLQQFFYCGVEMVR
ncbi:MAG: hypothetical protein AB7G28_18310 [Pirellulales bacterium]